MHKLRQVPNKTNHVVIIGAGLAGLTAALYARAGGAEVTVIERADHVGGRCATETITVPTPSGAVQPRFDTGATVWTMPSLLEDALSAVGLCIEEIDPTFSAEALSPSYHATFASEKADGRGFLDVYSDPELMETELARFGAAPETILGYRDLRHWLVQLFDHSFTHFMSASFDSPLDMVRSSSATSDLIALAKLGAFGALEPKVLSFLKDRELARVFSFQALYAGVPPKKARAVYGCISHMDTSMGVFYPHSTAYGSGMGTLAELLAAGLRRVGGTIITDTEVVGFDTSSKGIKSVRVRDENSFASIAADAVIATVDSPILTQWLEKSGAAAPKRKVPLHFSPSAVVAHGVVPASISQEWAQRHHTISFGEKWNETFEEISARKNGSLMSDPSLLITRPAITDSKRMVTDRSGVEWEPVSVLAPCPNLQSAPFDWPLLADAYVSELTRILEHRGFDRIAEHWQIGRVDTPQDWADQDMGAGSPFGLAHLFRQTGPFRPRNYSPQLPPNLVRAGSTTVPGVGVPTVMISGRLAAERLGEIR